MEPKGEENGYHSHAGKRLAHNEATRNKKKPPSEGTKPAAGQLCKGIKGDATRTDSTT